MTRNIMIALAATAVIAAFELAPSPASAGWYGHRADVRADRRDIRADRFDVRRDRVDLRRDWRDFGRDLRYGSRADIRRDFADIRRDRRDLRYGGIATCSRLIIGGNPYAFY